MNKDKYEEIIQTIEDNKTDIFTVTNIYLVLNRLERINDDEEITCKYDADEVINIITDAEAPEFYNQEVLFVEVPYVINLDELSQIIDILEELEIIEIF